MSKTQQPNSPNNDPEVTPAEHPGHVDPNKAKTDPRQPAMPAKKSEAGEKAALVQC